MKFFTNKNVVQKIIIAVVMVILFNFAVPIRSQAGAIGNAASDLVIELMHLVTFLGDSVMNMLSFAMVGTEFGSIMLEQDDPNLEEGSGSYIDPSNTKGGNVYETEEFKAEEIDGTIFLAWTVPNIIYCPENIFANKIAALDVNFINPNEYQEVNDSDMAQERAKSAAAQLRPTVATWYRSFRNIAIVGLLSVLVYLGIRILIGSTAQDKAKYKERLKDWVVALCLVFIIHFIMSAILIITENITSLFSSAVEQNIIVSVDNGVKFKTNLTGYIRFQAQIDNLYASISYTILYIMLVAFTAMFTFTYLKRLLYMAFCTMIAPLVALTYPIDKAGDGKAQAFNMWFREYFMNAILQPIHLLLYSALVTSAMSLAINNPVYAVAAIGFMIPAEKFIKKMFGLDKASTPSGLGSFAAGAVASQGINYLSNKVGGKSSSGGSKSEGSGEKEEEAYKRPKTLDNGGAVESTLPQGEGMEQQQSTFQGDSTRATSGIVGPDGNPISSNGSSYQNASRSSSTNAVPSIVGPDGNPISSRNNPQNLTPEEQREREQAEQQRQLRRSAWDPRRLAGVGKKQVGRISDAAYSAGFTGKGAVGRVIKKGGGLAVKGVRKGAGVAGSAVLKGSTALVAGAFTGAMAAASGDPSAAAKALAAGISTGAVVGGRASQKLGNATKNITWENAKKVGRNSGWFTQDEAIQREQKQYDEKWKHNKENIEYLRAQGVKSPKEFMEDGITGEFLKNDITDVNAIYNAKKLMREKNVSFDTALQASKYAKDIPEGFKGNDSAKNAFVKGQMNQGKTKEEAESMRDYIIAIQKNRRK